MFRKKKLLAAVIASLMIAAMIPANVYAQLQTENITAVQMDSEELLLEEGNLSPEETGEEAVDLSAAEELEDIFVPDTEEEILLEEAEIALSDLSELDEALQEDLSGTQVALSDYTFTSLLDFDEDCYTADLLANNPAENGNVHLFLDATSPAEIISADLDSNVGFQAAVASWKILTFDVVDTAEECLNTGGITEEQYYETALMDMIQNSLISEEASKILNDSFSTNLYSNLGLAADVLQGVDGQNITALKEELKLMDLGIESAGDFVEQFLESFGTTMTVMDGLVKSCGNVYDFIEKYTAYESLKQFCDTSLASTLDKMAQLCPARNVAMKMAITKVRDLCENEMAAQIYEAMLGAELDVNILFSTVLSTVVGDAILRAGGSWILVGQALGKGYANLAFNTDETLEKYFLMSSYAELLDLLRQSVLSAESAVKTNNTKANAQYLLDSLALYFTGLENGCDYASQFADIMHDARFIYGHLPESTYQDFTNHCRNIKGSYMNAHNYLLTQMWLVYFESDYEDLYNEYMDLQDTPGGVRTYVSELTFPNAQVAWRYDSGTHYVAVNVLPENASNKSVKYTSSDSAVKVTPDGKCTPSHMGTAVITATALDGSGVTASMYVTVTDSYVAFSDEAGQLQYVVTDDTEVSVRTLKTTPTSYTIPQSVVYEDTAYTVTSVDSSGFSRGAKYIESISLPDTIREIGYGAFRECKELTEINIPASLKKIGDYAFYKCSKLSNPLSLPEGLTEIGNYAFYSSRFPQISLPNTLMTIGEYAFAYSNLTSVEIPKGVLTVGKEAFFECNQLTRVDFLNCYATIGFCAFCSCRNLAQVELGKRIARIEERAFCDCKSLPSIIIPSSVSFLGFDIFRDCPALESIAVMTNNPYYCSDLGILFNKQQTILYCYPDAKPLTSYTVPDSVIKVEAQAFADNQYLEELILPEGLTDIGTQAFSYMASLKELLLPDAVNHIGIGIAENCQNLTHAKLPAACRDINSQTFYNCKLLTSVDVPQENQIEQISTQAFSLCDLHSFDFPENLLSIGSSAFSSNKNLAEAIIPDTVTYIGSSAFSYCTSLSVIHLPAALESLSTSSFNETAVKSIVIPEGITTVPPTVFANNKTLTSVTLPSSVTTIDSSAFSNDTNLTKVILTGDLPYIFSNAFYYVENLTLYYPAFNSTYDQEIASGNKYQARALTWAIDPTTRVDVSKCKIKLSASSFTYTGKPQLPKVTLTYGGNTLTSANYTVSGKDNTKAGIATITIKGRNNLKGSVTKTVKICPTASKVTGTTNAASGITVKWSKVANATGYVLYRNGTAIKTINGNSTVSFTDTGAKTNGKAYTYKIRTFAKASDGTKVYGAYSAEYKALYLSRPSCKLTNSAAGKMTVKWSKNAKAAGYQIKYTVGTTTKTVTVSSAATVSKVLSVKKGKTYKVYVRSFKTYSGKKVYSPWSAVKSLKITK